MSQRSRSEKLSQVERRMAMDIAMRVSEKMAAQKILKIQ